MKNYPYKLAAKLMSNDFIQDDVLDFVSKTKDIYDELNNIKSEIITLKNRINILNQENKFLRQELDSFEEDSNQLGM